MKSNDDVLPESSKVQQIFSDIVNVLDNNIRTVQYSLYTIGGLGLVGALYSIRVLTKIKTVKGIPKEFLKNHAKCLGRVQQVSVEEVSLPKFSAEIRSQSTAVVPVVNASSKVKGFFGKWRTFLVPHKEILDLPPSLKDMRKYNIFLQVEHIPTLNLFRRQSKGLDETLRLKLASIQVFENHVDSAKISLENEKVWFTMLRYDEPSKSVECLISKNQVSTSFNQILASRGYAEADFFDLNLADSKFYQKFYKNLLKAERSAQKQGIGVWSLLGTRKWWQFWK